VGFRSDPRLKLIQNHIREAAALDSKLSCSLVTIQGLERQLSYLAEAQADTSRITAEIIRRKQELCQDECRQQIFAYVWQRLSEEEKTLLHTFYFQDLPAGEAKQRLAEASFCSEATITRRHKTLLQHLGDLLGL